MTTQRRSIRKGTKNWFARYRVHSETICQSFIWSHWSSWWKERQRQRRAWLQKKVPASTNCGSGTSHLKGKTGSGTALAICDSSLRLRDWWKDSALQYITLRSATVYYYSWGITDGGRGTTLHFRIQPCGYWHRSWPSSFDDWWTPWSIPRPTDVGRTSLHPTRPTVGFPTWLVMVQLLTL